MSRFIAILGDLRVFAVILSLCTEHTGRSPVEAFWKGPSAACIVITFRVVERGDLPALGRKRLVNRSNSGTGQITPAEHAVITSELNPSL